MTATANITTIVTRSDPGTRETKRERYRFLRGDFFDQLEEGFLGELLYSMEYRDIEVVIRIEAEGFSQRDEAAASAGERP